MNDEHLRQEMQCELDYLKSRAIAYERRVEPLNQELHAMYRRIDALSFKLGISQSL